MSALPQPPSSLLRDLHVDVWHAHALASASQRVLASGDAALDAQLPGGGWPVGGLTELLQPEGVHQEWRLLLPALTRSGSGMVVLVGAVHAPFAPALAAQGLHCQRLVWMVTVSTALRLWAAEQALRCADVDAVLVWVSASGRAGLRGEQLRRLQIAAAEHDKLLFVMRPEPQRNEASPAALRLLIKPRTSSEGGTPPTDDALQVDLIKRRGPPLTQPLTLIARAPPLRLLLGAGG